MELSTYIIGDNADINFGNDDTGVFKIVEVDEENPVAVYDDTSR